MPEGILYLVALLALGAAYLAIVFLAPAGLKRPAQYVCAVLFVVLASFVVFGLQPPAQS